jgi:class 3 adenylate cyclase/tetratricopeptide (TPR) repeat protein
MSTQPESRRETRKTVTVVFVDVTGSTALGERLDPERVRRLMRDYFNATREVLERHGGTVEKFIGDAVMAVFGVPVVHEDDALRAVRAALEMRDRVRVLNEQLEVEHGETIEIRTGVNTGEVVAEETADPQSFVVGDAINVAARLEQAADPGEILLGSATYRLVRDAVRVEEVEPKELKGKSAPVSAYRLLELVAGPEPIARRLDSPMVGRERELQALRQALERAAAESSLQLFTILGSAGVGKSRLVHELVSVAGDHQVLRGRCLPYGEGVTYLPLADPIRSAAGIGEGDEPEAALDKLSELVGAEPEGAVISGLVAQILRLSDETAPQEELFWGVRRLLEVLARRGPLILVLDDIHWAEPTLLDLIEHLADWSRDAPILLVCSARPDLLEARPTWGGGKLNATSILLEPLPDDASAQLIDNLVGADTLAGAARRAITAAAEGNPLFVEEMLGVLVDDGVLRRVDGRWEARGDVDRVSVPPTIQALLAARLDRLEARDREVAEIGAVVGRVFDRTAVEGVIADDARADVRPRLMSLVRKDLLRPDRSSLAGGEAYRFRHVLIRDAAYDGLPKEQRARLHELIADWLQASSADRTVEFEEIAGYHLEQAYRYRSELRTIGPEDIAIARRAADLIATAARRAIARVDIPATVNLLTRATSLLPDDDPLRVRLLAELGAALAEVDDERAQATIREALALADAGGDDRLRAHVVVLGLLHGVLDHASLGYEDRQTAQEREAERALLVFEAAEDHLGLSRALRLRGDAASGRGRIADEEVAIEAALRHARAAGDAREQAECVLELSFVLTMGPTPVEDGIRRCVEEIAAYPGDRSIEGWMSHALAHLRARRAEFDEALELAERCRSVLLETGQLYTHALLAEVVADIHLLAGRPDPAIDVLAEAFETSDRLGKPSALLAAFLARVLCAAGRYEEAEAIAGRALDGAAWMAAIAKGQLARVRARAGQLDEAERLAREAVSWFDSTDWIHMHGDRLMDLADVLEVLGRTDEAREAAAEALELYYQKGDRVSAERAEALVRRLS